METLKIIKTLRELEELKVYLQDKEYIAYDTETDGVDKESRIIGFSICAEIDLAYYCIISYWDTASGKLLDLETKQGAKEFIECLKDKSLIMHNAPFDCDMTRNNYGIDLMPFLHTDTMILGHVLNENRRNGLKELGVSIYGQSAKQEQTEMKNSVNKNGGVLNKTQYELYKADAELIARYGAKDAILTFSLFHHFIPQLYNEGLDDFFYNDESMPLLRGPTYDLNTTGLQVDAVKLSSLRKELEAECMEAKAFIDKEIWEHVRHKYPGTTPAKTFNINAGQQRSWLLFEQLKNDFHLLTNKGKDICKFLDLRLPYIKGDKATFIAHCRMHSDVVIELGRFNPKTGKRGKDKKLGNYWTYLSCGKDTMSKYADKYEWVRRYIQYTKNMKLLSTYVEPIQNKMKYNIIRPSFLQHGTTSGRYSSRTPNFQNLPRDDKRIKACIISRPGRVFVGADYSQLEPRVFASLSQDERLLHCFDVGEDFYSTIGSYIFNKDDCSLDKKDPNSFAEKYPELRHIAKIVALAAPYGTTAPKLAGMLNKTIEECQEIIDYYFESYPKVFELMLDSHKQAKQKGVVYNQYGRPRRLPEAQLIDANAYHWKLPYEQRTLLNLAMNHRIQSTGASIMNRAAISCWKSIKEFEKEDALWRQVRIVLQVHDELILEGPEELQDIMAEVLKQAMENTVNLPGVRLIAEPKVAKNLADLK